ncbi:hypothetical protein ACPOL_5101 [Acidisarcina polymorpha]|uniref:Uncharacterized protein n=1 Tax=Acidisarcina polymorpha TaxID=2211140 RepID=A0A2Z5G6E1_9BACT|nr:hypothetical protein ACPOL_5101 [Acidisarcina polymorpha]
MYIERIQTRGDQHALLFAFLVERALDIDDGIGAAGSSTGMAKYIQIHR